MRVKPQVIRQHRPVRSLIIAIVAVIAMIRLRVTRFF
jgi:hypothetical protein